MRTDNLSYEVCTVKKIIIIGANSNIARNTLLMLNNMSEQFEIKLYDIDDSHKDNAQNYYKINITDTESVSSIDMDGDIIYMFTGMNNGRGGFGTADLFVDVNQKSLLNVLDEYVNQNSKAKLIFPSTRLVYKGSENVLKEDAKKEFKTIYAMSKYACEQYLEQYNRIYGVKYCILRICVPYGTMIKNSSSYGTAEFMLSMARDNKNISLYGDGSLRRTFTYMGDLCNILIRSAMSDKCINNVYNIGGEDLSLKEMAEIICKKYGVGVDYVPWPEFAHKVESGSTVFDDSKLRSVVDVNYGTNINDWINNM